MWTEGKPTHTLELYFEQVGTTVYGTYKIVTYDHPEHWGVFSLVGHIEDGVLTWETDSMWKQTRYKGLGFCDNRVQLTYRTEGGYEFLDGPWEGWSSRGPCAAANMIVGRKRADAPTSESDPAVPFFARTVEVKETLTASEGQAELKLWDDMNEDGDTVTVVLNDHIILEHHRVTKKPQVFPIQLQPGNNHLVIYAENLGRIKPNTAAVSLLEGGNEHTVILHSTLHASEAIDIVRE